jgi:hypothetical protein
MCVPNATQPSKSLTSSEDGRKADANAVLCNASSLYHPSSNDEFGDPASRACQRVLSIHLATAAETVSTCILPFANCDSRQLAADVRLFEPAAGEL